ncbi:MAG TPA: hypothetical protein VGI10_05025 [Polyangiaceae bacterium]
MTVALTDSLSKAAELTKRSLFTRSDFGKWLNLGFVVFLAQLAEGGYSFNIPNPNLSGKPSTLGKTSLADLLKEASAWLDSNMSLVLTIAVPVVLFVVALLVIFVWLSSYGKVILVESIVWDRHAVSEPWQRLRPLASSLFKFRLALGSLAAVLGIGVVVTAFWLAYPDLAGGVFKERALLATGIVAGYALCLGLPLALIGWLLDDFVVPIMYLDNARVGAAWRTFRAEIWPGNAGALVLYYLTLIPLAFGTGVVIFIVTLVTCCVAGLPYVSSVVFLPIFVFRRAYSLHVLQGLGKRVFPEPAQPPAWGESGRFGY